LEVLMSSQPRCTSSETLAWEAMRQMEEDPRRLITVLPVIDNNRVAGLLRMHDILQAGL
jgi:CBS domain-containing protein